MLNTVKVVLAVKSRVKRVRALSPDRPELLAVGPGACLAARLVTEAAVEVVTSLPVAVPPLVRWARAFGRTVVPQSDLPKSDLPKSDLAKSDLPKSDWPKSDWPKSDWPKSDCIARASATCAADGCEASSIATPADRHAARTALTSISGRAPKRNLAHL